MPAGEISRVSLRLSETTTDIQAASIIMASEKFFDSSKISNMMGCVLFCYSNVLVGSKLHLTSNLIYISHFLLLLSMAEEFERFKRFEYKENSNLVLQRDPGGGSHLANEPTGTIGHL